MPVKIDRFTFPDKTIKNFDRVGITPEMLKGWIDDGRANNIPDENIVKFIQDKFTTMNEPYVRGGNTWGALRFALSNIPVLGNGIDEAEAGVRSLFGDKSYEEYLKNARDSAKGAENIFERETHDPDASWFNRHIAKYAPDAINLTGNAVTAGFTGGMSMLPPISAAQGGLEGFLKGEGVGNRGTLAAVGAGTGYIVPAVLNKILPTKTIQTNTINQLAKSKDPLQKYSAKAIRAGTTPEEIIAKDVEKGMRPQLWSDINRASVGENVFRKSMQKSASKAVSTPYEDYVESEIRKVLPEYADAFAEQYAKDVAKKVGKKTLVEADKRELVMNAINKVTKKADESTKQIMRKVMNQTRANRGVADEMTQKAVFRPIAPDSGAIYSFFRKGTAPLRNLWNLGLMNTMKNQTVPKYVPDWFRSALESEIENLNVNSIK